MNKINRPFLFNLLALVLLSLGVHAWALKHRVPILYWDSAGYVVLQEVMAAGGGYKDPTPPNAPMIVQWPPLYSALLNVFVSDWRRHPWRLSILSLAATVLIAGLLFYFLGGGWFGNAASILFILNGLTFQFSTAVRPDMLFTAILMLVCALCAFPVARTWRGLILIALLSVTATYLRTIGIALVLAVVLWVWIEQGRLRALILAGAMLAATAPLAFHTDLAVYVSDYGLSNYVPWGVRLKDGLSMALKNGLVVFGRNTADILLGPLAWSVVRSSSSPWIFGLKTALSLGISVLVVYRWRRRAESKPAVIDIFSAVYLIALLPNLMIDESRRMSLPLLPLILYYLCRRKAGGPVVRAASLSVIAAALLAAGEAARSAPRLVELYEQPTAARWEEYVSAYRFIDRALGPAAVIFADAPDAVYLHTRRHALPFHHRNAGSPPRPGNFYILFPTAAPPAMMESLVAEKKIVFISPAREVAIAEVGNP